MIDSYVKDQMGIVDEEEGMITELNADERGKLIDALKSKWDHWNAAVCKVFVRGSVQSFSIAGCVPVNTSRFATRWCWTQQARSREKSDWRRTSSSWRRTLRSWSDQGPSTLAINCPTPHSSPSPASARVNHRVHTQVLRLRSTHQSSSKKKIINRRRRTVISCSASFSALCAVHHSVRCARVLRRGQET